MRIAKPLLAAFAVLSAALPVRAAEPIDLMDSFRIGSEGNAVCTAQVTPADKALTDMFDRGYAIICRDAAVPVGYIYALRERGTDPATRLAELRAERVDCQQERSATLPGLGAIRSSACTLKNEPVDYRVYAQRRNGTLYVAEGLAGYDDALTLGLRSIVANRSVPGQVSIATTGISDPTAFARALAGSISPQRAMAEAYRRNNSGAYAEAAEFFGTLSGGDAKSVSRPEALANEALQKSNLGSYGEAEMLFARAEPLTGGDPVVGRQLRNYRAMHLLNQGLVGEVYAQLDRPVEDGSAGAGSLGQLVIDPTTAARLSAETPGARRLGGEGGLTAGDKIKILDAQALQLRGSALRLEGKDAEAIATLNSALGQLSVVRDGRVAATQWLRAQILSDLAELSEKSGDLASAEARYRESVALVEAHYPASTALLAARGRLASFYARTGRTQQALASFQEIVGQDGDGALASPSLRKPLAAYFALLTAPDAPSSAAADLFRASQLLLRPGVAQTQAILARELAGGSDEASRLFRQSVNLSREVERLRVELGRARAATAPDAAKLANLEQQLRTAESGQVSTQAQLAQFPRYRALSNGVIPLDELQSALRPGEAYYKMVVVGGGAYALFITPKAARAYRIAASESGLEKQVDALRATISTVDQGQIVTYPFDVETAERLYEVLFAPVAGELASVRSLIFEPDGAMLRLPPNLLVMDRRSVETYKARAARPNDEGFDFTGVSWLGRDRDISTAVSPRAFRDLRLAAPSKATAQYIGFGQNQPADAFFLPSSNVSGDACSWSLSAWGRPISAAELQAASREIGGQGGTVITGRDFTDAAIRSRSDLDQYRIVHFATHGMLAPPRPECPARPALMTSFGSADSDGLLSFGEIFDLRLDADIVILSACDTAGGASSAANSEAGLTSGGAFALDGLVRAFVGAGGRLVIASHWPVPDDYDATQRLIGGLFDSPPGTPTAAALRAAQRRLMDDPATSHPFYWSAFALVGDGSAPLVRPTATQTAALR